MFALDDCNWLPYSLNVEINSIMCMVGSGCSVMAGGILFANYFCCSYSTILRSAFNDVFVAVVMVQVLQALQLLVFSLITVVHGRHGVQVTKGGAAGNSAFGMSYAMCNINASLHQFLDAACQVLQIAFFIVLADSRRLTSLEEVDDGGDEVRVIRTGDAKKRGSIFIEDEYMCSSSRGSSVLQVNRPSVSVDACRKRSRGCGQPPGASSCDSRAPFRKLRDCMLVPFACFFSCCPGKRTTTPLSPLQGPLLSHDIRNSDGSISGGVQTGNGRHTLLRVTWKAYLAAFLSASLLLLLCWMVLIYVPGLVVAPPPLLPPCDDGAVVVSNWDSTHGDQGRPRSLYNTLFFSQEFAWCWLPSGENLTPPLSSLHQVILLLLQVFAAYFSPILVVSSAVYAYFSLRRSSPSLLRDHPIVLWRMLVFCIYPALVSILGAVARFAIAKPSQSPTVGNAREGISAVVSFMYPLAATVNVVLFLYTENLLGWFVTACGRVCCCCCITTVSSVVSDDGFDCGSDVQRGGLASDGADNNNNSNSNIILATTGFCGIVKTIACSTVTGLPSGVAPYTPFHRPSTVATMGGNEG